MTPTEASEFNKVWEAVKTWPPERRLRLAGALLGTLGPDVRASGPRGVPVERVLGMAAGHGPPPDDATVERWLEEHHREKYE